jgi:predicted alpha/beta superfamily hydrolase
VPNERTLIGYSFGGLFGTYSLFNSPQTFNRYFIISPSLWWDNNLAFAWEKEYAQQNSDIKAKIIMTVGSEETGMVETIEQMVNLLKARNYPDLNLTYFKTAGQSHFSVFPTAFADGMKAIFK